MLRIHLIALSAAAAALAQASIVPEEIDTAAVVRHVEKTLPQGLRISPPVSGYTRKRGPLGSTPHFYVNLVDTSIKRLRINNQPDAYIIFLPAAYTYPSEQVYHQYHSDLVATNTLFRVYFVESESKSGIWQKCRNKLREAFSTPGFSESTSTAVSLSAIGNTPSSKSCQSDGDSDFVALNGSPPSSLDATIIPHIDFLKAGVEEVITFLNEASREYAPAQRPPLSIWLAGGLTNDEKRISLTMTNVSLRVILDNISQQAGLVYNIRNGEIVVKERDRTGTF